MKKWADAELMLMLRGDLVAVAHPSMDYANVQELIARVRRILDATEYLSNVE